MRAISREVATLKRAEIDAALAEMASAPEYQADVLQMETEFATAYWEAFKLAESQEEKTVSIKKISWHLNSPFTPFSFQP